MRTAVLFETAICEAGYEIQKRKGIGGRAERYVVARGPGPWRFVRALEEFPGLFRQFAIDPDVDQVLRLAAAHGPLFGGTEVTLPTAKQGKFVAGDRLDDWLGELFALRDVVKVLDLVAAGDSEALSRLITWAGADDMITIRIGSPPGPFRRDDIASARWRRDVHKAVGPGDVIAVGKIFATEEINKRLQGRVAPRLIYEPVAGRASVWEVPQNLAGALWLQLALYVERGTPHRRCEHCTAWFESQRKTKRFCSDSCRALSNQRRKP